MHAHAQNLRTRGHLRGVYRKRVDGSRLAAAEYRHTDAIDALRFDAAAHFDRSARKAMCPVSGSKHSIRIFFSVGRLQELHRAALHREAAGKTRGNGSAPAPVGGGAVGHRPAFENQIAALRKYAIGVGLGVCAGDVQGAAARAILNGQRPGRDVKRV